MQVNLANGLAAFSGSTFTNPGILTDGKNLDDFKTEGFFENKDKTKAGTIALHYPEDGSLGILKVFAEAIYLIRYTKSSWTLRMLGSILEHLMELVGISGYLET